MASALPRGLYSGAHLALGRKPATRLRLAASRAAILLGLAALYIVAAKFGLHFAFVHVSATPVWPPAGIALAALLLLGYQLWPAVFVGAFVANITTAGSIATSVGIATGNTLEAVIGALLVNRFAQGRAAFNRPLDVFKFAMLAGLGSTAVSATVGVTSLSLGGYARWADYGSIWATWWLGDATGVLVFAPVILLWYGTPGLQELRRRPFETLGLLVSVIGVGLIVFGGLLPSSLRNAPIAFLCIPVLVWAVFRFGEWEVAALIVVLAILAVRGTVHALGPFVAGGPNQALLLLQAFMATMSVTMLPVAAVVQDRRRTEASIRRQEEHLRAAIHSGVMGTWEWEIRTGDVQWSPNLEAIHGIPTGTFAGTYEAFLADVHPEDRERLFAAIQETLERGTHHIEYRIVRPDGAVRWVEGRGRLFKDTAGRPERMHGICTDITSRKHAEEERARLLAEEQAARNQAEGANRAKDEFLAMLSHELRNPLGAIKTALDVLSLTREPAAPQAARAQEIIGRQVGHLSRLVDDLLDVSRVMTGKIVLRRERLDLSEIAHRATLALNPQIGDRKLTVHADTVWVVADPTRLEQVVTNLLGNAVRYTPADGTIEVSVRAEGPEAVLSVSDTGIGIAPDLLPRVFDLFVQGDPSLARTGGGLGVGLTLVRRLVELHGGSVEAASDGSGKGSQFTVRLPVAAVPPRESKAPALAQVQTANARRRVVVIEDNPDSRQMLGALLRLLGHEVHEAADGPIGLGLAASIKPDVVFVDVGLPGMDGYEVARRLRGHSAGGLPRVVALTGYGRPEDRDRALAAGCDVHLVKPVDPRTLAEILAGTAIDVRSPVAKRG